MILPFLVWKFKKNLITSDMTLLLSLTAHFEFFDLIVLQILSFFFFRRPSKLLSVTNPAIKARYKLIVTSHSGYIRIMNYWIMDWFREWLFWMRNYKRCDWFLLPTGKWTRSLMPWIFLLSRQLKENPVLTRNRFETWWWNLVLDWRKKNISNLIKLGSWEQR